MSRKDYCPICHARVIRARLMNDNEVDLEPFYEVYQRLSSRDESTGQLIEPVIVALDNYAHARHICLPTLPRHISLITENERLRARIRKLARMRGVKLDEKEL